MHIRIKKSNEDRIRQTIWLPMEEAELEEVCKNLGIEVTTDPNCYIEGSGDDRFLDVITDKNVNIDELNYLAKRFDSFISREREEFYAVAFVEEPQTMADLINLSFNLHSYSLINSFDDFNKLGKDLYLSEKMAVPSRELEGLDGKSYALDVIKTNKTARVTPYGVLYRNSNEPEQIYNGKQFPQYEWKDSIATVELKVMEEREFIYLPCSDIEIKKALMRLGKSDLESCELSVINYKIPENILNMLPDDRESREKVDILNDIAGKFKAMRGGTEYFERLMDYVNPRTMDEVIALGESMYEFELFDRMKNAEDYGRHMICKSGHFEYDHNLEDYIDFKRYGQVKINNELGRFTDKGYIVYHGYNQKLSILLSENLGMEIPKVKEQKILKLYMPLTITTYEIENDYGYRETLNEPLELGSYDIVLYMDEILEAVERNNLPEEIERGLMHYYDEYDSVNSKVAKYEFSVEMVDDELMGVAILTLNDDLTSSEFQKIKDNISGQAADGWGEGFEQREIETDLGDIYVSFWHSSDKWFIKSAEEMGINQEQIMGGIQFE